MFPWLFACATPPPRYDVAVAPVPLHVTDLLDAPVRSGAEPGAKAAELAPVSSVGRAARDRVRTVSFGREARPALLATGGAQWAFAVPRDRDAELRVGTGVLEGEVCFRVWVDRELAEKRCAEPTNGWSPLRVQLPRASTPSEVVLESTGEGLGGWGDPRVLPIQEDPRPDVVVLIFDTTRWDHFGAAGYGVRATTPTLDAWLRRAVTYTQARATSPWTATSIGSALTGRWPPDHGAGARRVLNGGLAGLDEEERKAFGYATLLPDVPTLATILRGEGYETVAISSNGFFGARSGLDRGYGRFLRYPGSDYAAAQTGVRLAKSQLEVDRGAPLFLTVHFIDPHHPYTMRQPAPDGFPVPTNLRLTDASEGENRAVELRVVTRATKAYPDQLRVLYDAELRWLDDALAELLAGDAPGGPGHPVLGRRRDLGGADHRLVRGWPGGPRPVRAAGHAPRRRRVSGLGGGRARRRDPARRGVARRAPGVGVPGVEARRHRWSPQDRATFPEGTPPCSTTASPSKSTSSTSSTSPRSSSTPGVRSWRCPVLHRRTTSSR
jgi:hypothetical protein